MFDINKLNNATVFDRDGDKIGTVGSVYVKDQTEQPSFVTVKTGLFGTKETFVPVDAAKETADGLQVPYTKAFVKDAPNVDADGHISETEEDEIYRYYENNAGRDGVVDRDHDHDRHAGTAAGVGAAGAAGAAAGHRDHDRDGLRDGDRDGVRDHDRDRDLDRDGHRDHDADGGMVRREEELHVGKERVQTGRVRLRKHVVTEQKNVTVPVEREEVQVVREPVADGHSHNGGRLRDDEQTVTLSEERPVVDKEVVDKERIGLEKNVVSDEERVRADVRREEVDVDRDGGRGKQGLKDKLDRDNDGRLDSDDITGRDRH